MGLRSLAIIANFWKDSFGPALCHHFLPQLPRRPRLCYLVCHDYPHKGPDIGGNLVTHPILVDVILVFNWSEKIVIAKVEASHLSSFSPPPSGTPFLFSLETLTVLIFTFLSHLRYLSACLTHMRYPHHSQLLSCLYVLNKISCLFSAFSLAFRPSSKAGWALMITSTSILTCCICGLTFISVNACNIRHQTIRTYNWQSFKAI